MDAIEAKFGARWRFHDGRAAYITRIALTGSAVTVQQLARHSDFSTTQRYIDVADAVRRVAAEQSPDRPALRAAP